MTDPYPRSADVVVVGAGSAGAVIARHYARAGRSVVVLEKGPISPAPAAQTSLTTLPIGIGASRVQRYRDVRGRDIVRGSGVGGSAVVNGGYFLRGHADDYVAWPYSAAEISRAFDALDGGGAGGGTMRVRAFADDELGPVAGAFDLYWRERGPTRAPDTPWAGVGLNRVRSNQIGGHRFPSSAAFGLAAPDHRSGAVPSSPLLIRAHVHALVMRGDRCTAVMTDRGRIDCGEVVLTAGTIGTATLITPVLGPLPLYEHPERLVHFRAREPLPRRPLVQTVVHTPEGVEIRCYNDDFARYIHGVPARGVPVGIADMTIPTAGTITPVRCGSDTEDAKVDIDVGAVSARSRARLADGAGLVTEMLASTPFHPLVAHDSVTTAEEIGFSSHAWGTLALGDAVGPDGALHGLDQVRVADASVLPQGLRSGPHASVLLAAQLIAHRAVAG